MTAVLSPRPCLPHPPHPKSASGTRKRPGSPMDSDSPASRRCATDTPAAAYDRRQIHIPRSKRELFTRHVFPVSHIPFKAEPFTGYDVNYALDQLAWRGTSLRVQYHADLETLLFKEASRIADRPNGSSFATHLYDTELLKMHKVMLDHQAAVREVCLKTLRPHEHGQQPVNVEYELCKASFYHIGELISEFIEDSEENFKDVPRSFASDGWKWLDTAESLSIEMAEWVAMFRDITRAACQWTLNLTPSDMRSMRTGGLGQTSKTRFQGPYPGFTISGSAGVSGSTADCSDPSVHGNSVLACVLAWYKMHYQQCRWFVFCNAQTAIVLYLARPDTLFVSDVIYHDAGEKQEALTIAMALLAVLTISPESRPTCTFNNDALRFHLPLFTVPKVDYTEKDSSVKPPPTAPRTEPAPSRATRTRPTSPLSVPDVVVSLEA